MLSVTKKNIDLPYPFQIHVSKDRASSILKDLSGRRSHIVNIDDHHDDRVVQASVPLAELKGYSTHIRTLASGNCSFTMEFSHYEPMSDADQNKAIEAVTGFSPIWYKFIEDITWRDTQLNLGPWHQELLFIIEFSHYEPMSDMDQAKAIEDSDRIFTNLICGFRDSNIENLSFTIEFSH